jgi:RimJ/RimL family protein N-acetyltransferase
MWHPTALRAREDLGVQHEFVAPAPSPPGTAWWGDRVAVEDVRHDGIREDPLNGRHSAARRALADVDVSAVFARVVVDGLVEGELWADRPREPRAFHAVHPCGMSFVWGPDVASAADDVVRRIGARAARGIGEWLQVEPRWHSLDWDRMLGAVPLERYAAAGASTGATVGAVRRTRLHFAFEASAFAARLPTRTDAGWAVRPATEADFTWKGSTVPGRFWTDAAAFLARGGGWVVEVDGAPAAISFGAFCVDDEVEIGIETHPAFRRRGLASVAASAMIEDLLAGGLTPVWSCREDNVGSLRLAQVLGFAVSRRLPYFEVLPRVTTVAARPTAGDGA